MSDCYDHDEALDGPQTHTEAERSTMYHEYNGYNEDLGLQGPCSDTDDGYDNQPMPEDAPSPPPPLETDMSDTCYRALVKLDGRLFGGMTRETFSMTTMRGRQLFEFTDTASNISGTLEYPDFTVKVGGAIVGVLADDCMVRCSKQTHVSIDDQAEYRCSRIMGEDTDKLTLVKIGPGASTTIDLPMMDFTRNDSAVITHQGKQSSIGNTKAATLRSSLEKQVYKHIEKRLGLAPGSAAAAFTFHIGIVNIFGCEDPEQVRTTEYDLVAALLTAKPEIKEMFKFAPDAKSANCNGLYLCDPDTNIWSQVHNSVVEKYLVDAFLHGTTLSTADERFVKTQRSGGELRKLLVREVVDAGFEASLDANLDLFAVSNGVFWLRDGMVQGFRPITTDDRVCTTAEWSYSAAEGQAKRGEVDTFLTQVFPVEAERRVVLSYVAHLMSGRRSVKKFLVLTDKRAGNNGKSTFAKLVMRFFGPLSKSSTKFVCRGSFDKDRDSHDGGLECFKGKRLLVAEELKHTMTPDEAMLKSYAAAALRRRREEPTAHPTTEEQGAGSREQGAGSREREQGAGSREQGAGSRSSSSSSSSREQGAGSSSSSSSGSGSGSSMRGIKMIAAAEEGA
ncbi:MAG: hypothetical protein WDW38_006693 [Sanguina aurantia]